MRHTLPEALLEEVARRFRALGEPLRLRILRFLEDGERSVGDLTSSLAASQSNVSRHLQALYEAGLVDRRREGAAVYYRIADPSVLELCRVVCDGTQKAIRKRLALLAR